MQFLKSGSSRANLIRRSALAAVVSSWLVCVGTGMATLARYEFTPGQSALTRPVWPADAEICRNEAGSTLLMFVHPRCPCSRASLDQLDRILARCQDRLTACIVFCVPDGFADEWAKSSLWRAADAMPNVTACIDVSGVESKRFGARTSGQVLLYDAGGRLRFGGGITPSRGHGGDNVGEQKIISIVLGSANAENLSECSAFGCPLFDEVEE